MKKFSEIDSKTFENKKYKEKNKNVIYSMIKENINVNILNEGNSIENTKISLNGIDKLINNIESYVEDKILQERLKTLESIKSAIATGTLSLEMINEEIDKCDCSETCPTDIKQEKEDSTLEDDFDDFDDFDNKIDPNATYITTNEDDDEFDDEFNN